MIVVTRPVLVLVCTATLVGCRPLSEHPLVVKAATEVSRNPRVAEVLGQPVTVAEAVRGRPNEQAGIADLEFDVTGPKGPGVVIVEGKKSQGAWGVTRLELRPSGGPPLSLTADIATDTPKFDPTAAPTTPTTPVAHPGEVEITLPPGVPGG